MYLFINLRKNLIYKAGALIILTTFVSCAFGQTSFHQIIKGQVYDEISKNPLMGATVSLIGDSNKSVTTDGNGRFLISDVPLGRQSIIISYVGYENRVIQDILLTSGKEAAVDIPLTQKVSTLQEVVIRGRNKRILNNEMVVVSGQSFRAEDAVKYAGALGDPSRMVAAFAGVTSADDSRNDIVVRGNSPSGLLWKLEGIDIPNPNHYGSLNSTGGPVSLLNINNLDKSDFLTGAFPAQYGNALSSVFDLKLRNGNPDKDEYVAQISFTGFELGAKSSFFET